MFTISTSWAYERPGIHPLLSDDFSGSLGLFFTNIDSEIGIDGRKKVDLEDDLGFGAGYHYLSTDIDIDTNNWSGNTKYTYYGPKIFMTINF